MVEVVSVPNTAVQALEKTGNYAKFVAEPLERGFGITLGNSLRRVLLNSLVGAAVTSVKIEGIQHEYSIIPFMKEDVTQFLLNVKGIRLKPLSDAPAQMRLEVSGEGKVCAGDIQPCAEYQIVNPEHHLATLDSPEAKLSVEFFVSKGRGYIPASHGDGAAIGVLPVDAIFTPVRKVNYNVERTRVGQQTDYDRLILEVWTDGTLTSSEAVRQSAQLLVDHFFRFCVVEREVEIGHQRQPVALTIPAEQYNTPVEKLNISARTFNALKRSNIHKVGEVLEKTREELLSIRNFGEKSLEELYQRLSVLGYLPKQSVPAAEAEQDAPEASDESDDDVENDDVEEEE